MLIDDKQRSKDRALGDANGTRGDRRRMWTDKHRLSPIGQIGLDPGMYTASNTEAITEAFTNIREAQSLLTFRRHLNFSQPFPPPSDPPANAPWFLFKISALYKSFTYLLTYLLTVVNYNTYSSGNTNHNVNWKQQFLLQLQLKEFWKNFLFPNFCGYELIN